MEKNELEKSVAALKEKLENVKKLAKDLSVASWREGFYKASMMSEPSPENQKKLWNSEAIVKMFLDRIDRDGDLIDENKTNEKKTLEDLFRGGD